MSELFPILTGCLISSALIIIEHLLFWPYKKLNYLARYVLGTIALGLGLLVWAALTDRLIAAVAFGAIAFCGGATVIAAYWIRLQFDTSLNEADRKAFWAGQIAGLPASEEYDGSPSRSNPRSN